MSVLVLVHMVLQIFTVKWDNSGLNQSKKLLTQAWIYNW